MHDKLMMSIDEFAERHDLGVSTVYKLIAAGKGPRTAKVGDRRLISAEAAAEWRHRMEQAGA